MRLTLAILIGRGAFWITATAPEFTVFALSLHQKLAAIFASPAWLRFTLIILDFDLAAFVIASAKPIESSLL